MVQKTLTQNSLHYVVLYIKFCGQNNAEIEATNPVLARYTY